MDLENNSNQKKYTVNQNNSNGLVISKALCTLMAIGTVLLAVLVGLVVFFLVPRDCHTDVEKVVASLTLPEEIDERLPRSIQPLRYRIDIQPDLTKDTIEGTETIVIRALENTRTITINANSISIVPDSVDVRLIAENSEPIPVKQQGNLGQEQYQIVLEDELLKDNEYEFSLRYQGTINNHLQGLYKFQYTTLSGDKKYGISTQFSPTDARLAFPCFDEPSFKAKFIIRIARPGHLRSLSNMPLDKSVPMTDNRRTWYWDNYKETPEMSTYLVAFMLSDLVFLPSAYTKIKVWTRPDMLRHAEYAVKIAPRILKYFEKYFSIEYPLPKMDLVALPQLEFSAMENWGLITFREGVLLFDNETSTVLDQRTIAIALSHEIAHQWFGNLATPKWWNDLWLKEGFATYLQYLGVHEAEPNWQALDEFLPSEIERAMALDSLKSSRPISFEVINSRQIRQVFDEISYAKGACIIRMMNHFLGEDTFKNGLIKYLNQFNYSNADRNDLFASLTEEAHLSEALLSNETVRHIMDTWSQQAGFPVINVTPNKLRNELRILQKRFLWTKSNGTENTNWWIPISYTSSTTRDYQNTKPKFWMRGEKEIQVPVDPIGDWYLLNLNYTGYYIVNYDEANWKMMSERIMTVPPIIRAQLISDSMDLARANQLDYEIPLRMIARMATQDREIMFIPISMALSKLEYLYNMLYDTPTFGLFQKYQKAIFAEMYKLVKVTDDVDHYISRRIRLILLDWACRASNSACARDSSRLFQNWQDQERQYGPREDHWNPVPPNLRPIVYCAAIREGDEERWRFAYDNYVKATSPSEENVLLDALGCTKIKWLLSGYLNKLFDGYSIKAQHASRAFRSIAKNKEGTLLAFAFVREHWEEFLKQSDDGVSMLGRTVQMLAVHMTTDFHLDMLIDFRDRVAANSSTASQAFDVAIETVKANIEWMKNNYNQITEWLTKHEQLFDSL